MGPVAVAVNAMLRSFHLYRGGEAAGCSVLTEGELRISMLAKVVHQISTTLGFVAYNVVPYSQLHGKLLRN